MASIVSTPMPTSRHTPSNVFDLAIEDALKSNTPLLSWRSALNRVTTLPRAPIAIRNLKQWLLAVPQTASLAGSYAVVPPPNPISKQAFETKTAMINITADTVLPVSDIKDDSIHLSKTLNLDELEALRICILEFQERSPTLPANSDDTPSATIPTMSMFGRLANKPQNKSGTGYEVESAKHARRARQVMLYLSERRYRIKVITALIRIIADHDQAASRKHPLYLTSKKVLRLMIAEARKSPRKGLVEAIIADIQSTVSTKEVPDFYKQRKTQAEAIAAREEWERQKLVNVYHLLQMIFILMYRVISPSSTIAIIWYRFMGSTGFLTDQKFLSKPIKNSHQSLLNSIIPLGAIISLQILAVDRLEALMNGRFSDALQKDLDPSASYYLEDSEAVELIHEVLTENVGEKIHPPASLAGWAWAIGLSIYSGNISDAKSPMEGQSGSSAPSGLHIMQNKIEKTLGAVIASSTRMEGPALYLAKKALKANLLNVIKQFIDGVPGGSGWSIQLEEDRDKMQDVLATLMRMGISFVGWEEEVIDAFLATHSMLPAAVLPNDQGNQAPSWFDLEETDEQDTLVSTQAVQYSEHSLARDFWTDMETVSKTIHIARCRFPYETLPFCAILHATTPRKIINEPFNLGFKYLRDFMQSFTYSLPVNFRGTEVDSEDASNIILTQDLIVVQPRREDGGGAFILPSGIVGRVLSTNVSPPIVRWDYHYSGASFFGRLLERVLLEESFHDSSVAIEILGIFDNILSSSLDAPADAVDDLDGVSPATVLLEQASDWLAPNSDIVSVILDLFESSLPFSVEAKSVALASACLRVIKTMIPILPGRIWPWIARSALLERNGRGGVLTKILESVEIVQGDYTFLLDAFALYEALLSDAIAGVVYSGTIGSPGSIVSGSGVGSGISKDMQTSILQDWTRFWCSVFESFTTWKYSQVKQRLTLNFKMCQTFSQILETVYGVSSDENEGHGLFDGLATSADIIASIFLDDVPTGVIDPILLSINEGLETIETTVHNLFMINWIKNVTASLHFGGVALKVQHLQRRPPSHLEKELYGRCLQLVSLYEVDEHYRQPVIGILDSLISGSRLWTGEPPSILGYIGVSGANHLVGLLQRLGGRIEDEELESSIWKFFCTVISHRQQGLAIKLVTGSSLEIGISTKEFSEKSKASKSMLALALEILVNIKNLSPSILLSTLQAVSTAQDFWGPIITNLPNYSEFLSSITDYVQSIKVNYFAKTPSAITQSCNETAAAAYVAQILTMHLYQAKNTKQDLKSQEFFTTLLSKLSFYVENGVTITGYKPSMHGLLAFNFRNKWPCCHLENLRKSTMKARKYGTNYFYDIDLAERILSWDRGWNNVMTRRTSNKVVEIQSGFRMDVESVNLNLALIDSQVFLLDAWSNLALELTRHKEFHNVASATAFMKTVNDALKSSISEAVPPPIALALNTKRSNLAFSLLRRVEAIKLPYAQTETLFNTILETSWQVIAAVESDFLQSLSHGGNEASRNLLRLLYSTLNQTLNGNRKASKATLLSPHVISLIVGVFDVVVAKAFKALANAAYESPATANPGDMLIVIGILQTILAFQGLEPVHDHMVMHLANSGTIRTATILFTWATKLVAQPTDPTVAPDPLYGEISVAFLVKLTALPVFAEQVALNTVFNSLSEGDLAQKMQAGQLHPTTTPRLHNIWSKGFLPLLLNVLFALDKRIAPEIAMFLRSYIRQINFSITYMDKPEYITLPQLEEITDLSALLILLERLGSSLGDEVLSSIRTLDAACDQIISHKTWLSRVLIATNAEEDALLQTTVDGTNMLAQKVVEQAHMIQKIVSSMDDGDEQVS